MLYIIAAGGGTQNPLWMQIIADVLGKEIEVPAVTVGACYGDALMAALGSGAEGFENYAALSRIIRAGKTYVPDPAAHEIYGKYQAIYDKLYDATKTLAHALSGREKA